MINKYRMLTPGPTPLPERVRLALAQDMIHHRKPAFAAIMAEIQRGLKVLFGTAQPVLPLSCSGTGGMTAAVHGLFAQSEKVIVIEAGKFGQRWSEIARVRGLSVIPLAAEWGKAATADQVTKCIREHPDAKGLLMQLSETSTGVLQPVQEIAQTLHNQNMLLVVDGISGVGISPCPMDAWQIDCLLTGSQKGLMLPPGLALLALSERAWKRAENVAPSCFYFNLLGERDALTKGQNLFTSPVNLIVGLRESLRMFFGENPEQGSYEFSLERIYAKQWALTCLVREGVRALGLQLFAQENYTWGLTSICMPAGINAAEVIKIAEHDCGVIFASGQDHLKGKIIRFAHMGWIDWSDLLAGLHALAWSLRAAGGYAASRDYLEIAIAAYHQALASAPGHPVHNPKA